MLILIGDDMRKESPTPLTVSKKSKIILNENKTAHIITTEAVKKPNSI